MYSNAIPQIVPFSTAGLPKPSLARCWHPINFITPSSLHLCPKISEFGNQNPPLPPISMLMDWTTRQAYPYFPERMMDRYEPPQSIFTKSSFQTIPQYHRQERKYPNRTEPDGQAQTHSSPQLPPIITEPSRNNKQSSADIAEGSKLAVKLSNKPVPGSDIASRPSGNPKESSFSSDPYLGDIQNVKVTPIFEEGKTHQWRNVYKCILRQMTHLVLEEKAQTQALLLSSGYSLDNIKIAFRTILYYGEKEIKKGTKKVAQKVVCKIVEKKSVFAEILREALQTLLNKWEGGDFGKMYAKNLTIYKEVCLRYLEEVNKTLSNTSVSVVPCT